MYCYGVQGDPGCAELCGETTALPELGQSLWLRECAFFVGFLLGSDDVKVEELARGRTKSSNQPCFLSLVF